MPRYVRPKTTEEALALMAEREWRVLAGGTDFYPSQGSRPIRDDVLDINGLDELADIRETDEHFVLGARANWTDVLGHELPPAFDALKLAAREVGSIQIQNRGTVAGNLCNASPAADGVPPLMVLDTKVELASSSGSRLLPLGDFVLGNRRTARRADELVVAVRVPKTRTAGASHFLKLGARSYLVISIAMAAARVAVGADGRIREAAVSVGACSETAQRLRRLECALVGRLAAPEAIAAISETAFDGLSPIDDVRGTALYRRQAAIEIVRRTLIVTFEKAVAALDPAGRAAA